MKVIFYLFLVLPILSYSQNGDCKLSKTKAKVVRANNVTQNGKQIQKGDYILVDKIIPDGGKTKFTKTFFDCNHLVFERNGELIFRFDGELVNKQINYNHYKEQNNHSNSNLSSRGNIFETEEFDCTKKTDDRNLFSLFQKEKAFIDRACLQEYFHENYWLTDKDVLILDSPFFDMLVFSSEDEEVVFQVEEGRLEIDSQKLPVNDWFDIYILKNGEADLIAEEVYLINLKKTADSLIADGFSEEEVRNYIDQNLLFFDIKNLSETKRNKLEQNISTLFE